MANRKVVSGIYYSSGIVENKSPNNEFVEDAKNFSGQILAVLFVLLILTFFLIGFVVTNADQIRAFLSL